MTVRMMLAIAASSPDSIGRMVQAAACIVASSAAGKESLPEAFTEFQRRQSGREQEALSGPDAEVHQELPLRFVLHAFGHQRETEAAGDAADGLAHRHVRLVVRHALQEHLAELEAVDRQPPQVVERAVAFAEIVD